MQNPKLKVVLVEDSPAAAQDFRRALAADGGFVLQAHYESAEECHAALDARGAFDRANESGDACKAGRANDELPDLVVHDLGLPGMDGVDSIGYLRRRDPELRLVAWTVFEEEATILAAIEAGASGYLLKDVSPELLCAELRVLHLGGAPLTPRVAELILQRIPAAPERSARKKVQNLGITPRETEVLNLIALGLSYRGIAERLEVSDHTVRRHIESIYRKLGVHSKTEAVMKGRRFGLL